MAAGSAAHGCVGKSDELGDGPMHQPRVGEMRNGLWLRPQLAPCPWDRWCQSCAPLIDFPGSARRAAPRRAVGASASSTIANGIQRAHSTSSERLCMCFRMNKPATSRDGTPCCPPPSLGHRTKAVIPKLSVDQRRQPHQRWPTSMDLIKRRKQEVFLATIPWFAHRLHNADDRPSGNHESLEGKFRNARMRSPTPGFSCKIDVARHSSVSPSAYSTRRYMASAFRSIRSANCDAQSAGSSAQGIRTRQNPTRLPAVFGPTPCAPRRF